MPDGPDKTTATTRREQPHEFFFGAMSPYSWFAAERIERLLGPVKWSPIFAGGLFKQRGEPSWGLTSQRAGKLADCEARAEKHALGPIVWPQPWPTLDLHIARALTYADWHGVARDLGLAAMRIAFREGGDLGQLEVVEEALRRTELDPATAMSAIQTREIKLATRARTADAFRRGVRGVPTTFFANRPVFGDDQLDDAAAAWVGSVGPSSHYRWPHGWQRAAHEVPDPARQARAREQPQGSAPMLTGRWDTSHRNDRW